MSGSDGDLFATLELLDRQVVDDPTGRMVAKVDDVELDLSGDRPVVTALLTGPQAWGPRLPGLLGRLVVSVHRRLHPDAEPQPGRIPVEHVVEVDSAVRIEGFDVASVQGFGRWADEQVISRIPGAEHAPE